jgi:hypothetical protein
VVKDLLSCGKSKSETSMILWEAKSLLHDLPGFIFEKVKRDCNTAAHDIASFSFSEWSEGVLVESLP